VHSLQLQPVPASSLSQCIRLEDLTHCTTQHAGNTKHLTNSNHEQLTIHAAQYYAPNQLE
jgi:hypothetical protein